MKNKVTKFEQYKKITKAKSETLQPKIPMNNSSSPVNTGFKKSGNLKLIILIGIVIAVLVIGVAIWFYVYPVVAMFNFLGELDDKIRAANSPEEVEEIMIDFLKDPLWIPICVQVEYELPQQQEKMKRWVDEGNDYRNYPDNDILPDLIRISQLCSLRDNLP